DNGILLEISDDGIGFLPEDTVRSTGLGMVSMRERLRLVGGDLNISSVPGRGTVVRAWVPRVAGES
ncbi:MAG TPA: ATP-binding protein, partial [Gemmatimonadales bacterium]|nr:ATP-binding protein [Gemmatimonadales bacterium]